jgi:hypothetical protein
MKNEKCNCGYEQILGELDYIRSVDMPHLENEMQRACDIISALLDALPPETPCDLDAVKNAEQFYRERHIAKPQCDRFSLPDDLPF